MADEKYLNNRLKYHTASRVATQTGEALAQALNVDGHIVTTNKVWASPPSAFINNVDKANTDSVDATNDLVTAFKVGATSDAFWNGGTVWTNPAYPAVRLYENVKMTTVKGSDGGGKFQAYEILASEDGVSSGSIRIVDWIAPTAVADRENGKPVAGYSGIPKFKGTALKLADTGKWAEAGGHYEFVYIAGMLTFEPGFTPQDKDSTNGTTSITLTAFKYIGEYLSNSLTSLETDISDLETDISTLTTKVNGFEAIVSESKEIDEAIIQITSSGVTGIDIPTGLTSEDWSGEVENGVVTIEFEREVLGVQQLDDPDTNTVYEDVYPDESFNDTTLVTTLSADFGDLLSGDASFNWRITYRV